MMYLIETLDMLPVPGVNAALCFIVDEEERNKFWCLSSLFCSG